MTAISDILEALTDSEKENNYDLTDLLREKLKDHSLEELLKMNHNDVIEISDYDGRLHEIIDSFIEVYNYPLRKWSVDHYDYIERAIAEGLTEDISDFHELIQRGQYVYHQEKVYEELESLIDAYYKCIKNQR